VVVYTFDVPDLRMRQRIRTVLSLVALAGLIGGCGGGASGPVGTGPAGSGGSASGSGGVPPRAVGTGGSGASGASVTTAGGGAAGVVTGPGTGGATAGADHGTGGRAGQGDSTGGGGGGLAIDAGTDAAASSGSGGVGLPAGPGGGPGTDGAVSAGPPGTDVGDAGAGAGGGSGTTATFTCTLLVGPSTMGQWFNGGFLTYPGIDAMRWELIMVAHHYTNAWAVPGDPAWKTAVSHPCARSSTAPDRVAFMATQWTENTSAQWEADFDGIIKNIQVEWPTVQRIELMPSPSAPGDKLCPAGGTPSSETIIPAYGYAAIDAMPSKYPGLVFSTPHFEVPSCSDFIGGGTAPQYAPDANATSGPAVMDVVNVFGAYYAAHP
jgi:hypothetical protein